MANGYWQRILRVDLANRRSEVQQIDDYDACIPVVSESQDPENRDCDWDAGAAKECVEGINMMTCDDLYDSDYPLACEKTCTRGQ